MRYLKVFLLLFVGLVGFKVQAQQKYNPNEMTFSFNNKPNIIIYNDTIYKGSKAFKKLFLRTNDFEIIDYYKRHQSNKIIGNAFTTVGSLALTAGLIYANSNRGSTTKAEKNTGWVLAGSGLLSSIVGGYFITQGAKNLYFATATFNRKHIKKTNAAIGVTNNGVGFVVNL
ncbi:MAG: hypothetical protein ACOVNY_03670 [Chitinophagaceae bacterium]